jgi:hypothetical protein
VKSPLVTVVNVPPEALSRYVPGLSIEQSTQLATPAVTTMVLVVDGHVRVPPGVFGAVIVNVTAVVLSVVTTSPFPSTTET